MYVEMSGCRYDPYVYMSVCTKCRCGYTYLYLRPKGGGTKAQTGGKLRGGGRGQRRAILLFHLPLLVTPPRHQASSASSGSRFSKKISPGVPRAVPPPPPHTPSSKRKGSLTPIAQRTQNQARRCFKSHQIHCFLNPNTGCFR